MFQNKIWLAFVAVVTATVLWFTFRAFTELYYYQALSYQAPAETTEWSVKTLYDDRFVLRANFTFFIEGKLHHGTTVFSSSTFRNPWAAEQALAKYSNKKWNVWYSPDDFSRSTLQKSFPVKECFSAGILWALLIYFVGLGYYVKKKTYGAKT